MLEIFLTEISFVRGILKQIEVFSHNRVTEKAIFYVLKVIVNLLHPSGRHASPSVCPLPPAAGAAVCVQWRLPGCRGSCQPVLTTAAVVTSTYKLMPL